MTQHAYLGKGTRAGTVVIVVVTMLAPVSGYIMLPLGLTTDADEYAHAQFVDSRDTLEVQEGWGRGAEVQIRVGGECNRPDKHDIASWVGTFLVEGGSTRGAIQVGFVQIQGDACALAAPFSQHCWDCDDVETGYSGVTYGVPVTVPAEGLVGHFSVVVFQPSASSAQQVLDGAAPSNEPCPTRIVLGLLCPISMNHAEYLEYACAELNTMGDDCESYEPTLNAVANYGAECDVLSVDERRAHAAICQAAAGATLILAGRISTCPSPSLPATAAEYDVPVCISPDDAELDVDIQITGACDAAAFYNGALIGDKFSVPCQSIAKYPLIEYEAAANTIGYAHVGPGTADEPTSFTAWKTIGRSTSKLVPADAHVWDVLIQGACPPYESKYERSGPLISWAQIGPNIDGTTNRCDTDVTAGFASLWIACLALVLGAVVVRKKKL